MSCSQCSKLQKKLRILQSDFDFEFKKFSEDKSTEKALFEVNAQKQVRKWQQKYTKQRLDHQQNSKKWLQKIDSITLECQTKLKQIKMKQQQSYSSLKEQSQKQFQQYKSTIQMKHSISIKKLIEKNQNEIAILNQNHKSMIERMRHEHGIQIQKIKKHNVERQVKVKSEYESCILGLKTEKNADQKNNLKLQDQFRIEKTRLIGQIYHLKQKIGNCESKIEELKKTIQCKDNQISEKQAQIVNLTSNYDQTICQLKKKYEKQLLDQQVRMQQKIKQFYQNQLRITQRYQQSITKIQSNRQIELELYRHNMNQIKNCIENRVSRIEDLQEILVLRQKLTKREKDCETLQRQLKEYQLQLQNKEDTYNKIFIPTINSTHLPGQNIIKRKQLKMKRPAGRSVTTVRQILANSNINSNNLPLLNNLDKKMLLPPKSTKIL